MRIRYTACMVFGFSALTTLLKPKRVGARRKHPLDGAILHAPTEAGPVAVDVKGSSVAQRLILRLDRITGRPRLTVPRGVGKAHAERFLSDHAGWISARLKAQPHRIPFVEGAVIPVFGTPHRIMRMEGGRGLTRIEEHAGEMLLIVHGTQEQVAGRVLRFLKTQALDAFTKASHRHAQAAGVSLGKITIKDTKSRWGSCSAKGDLAYSWRIILAPPDILDYLAAHEVAHRLEMNHSTRYWRHVARLFPTYRAAEDWLTRHGASLHLYGRVSSAPTGTIL